MKKNINLIITVIIAIMLIMLPVSKTQAANFTLSNEKVTLDIEKSTSITINASTHTGRINITSSDTNVATVNTTSLWVENNSQTITISAKNAGNATITISGLLYDTTIEEEKEYTKTINVTVNKLPEVKPDPEPEPEPEPENPSTQEPEQPETPKTLEFTSVNETVYATGTVNVRQSYSASSKSLGQLNKNDSVTRTGVSKVSSGGYNWSKIIYNGTTAYVISSKLTTTEPKQEEPTAQEPEPEPEIPTVEEPTTIDEDIENDKENVGLNSLEIEGVTLSPVFSPNVYEYRVILKKDISELAINAVAAIEGATITIAGNKNLQEGENLVTILVYNAKTEGQATYQITINKNTVDLTDTDKLLQIGNKEATRNLIIFIAVFAIAIVALIVIMILKHRKQSYEEDYDEVEEQPTNLEEITPFEEHTEIEQNVENTDEKVAKEEYNETKKEKRKGKHF